MTKTRHSSSPSSTATAKRHSLLTNKVYEEQASVESMESGLETDQQGTRTSRSSASPFPASTNNTRSETPQTTASSESETLSLYSSEHFIDNDLPQYIRSQILPTLLSGIEELIQSLRGPSGVYETSKEFVDGQRPLDWLALVSFVFILF